MKASNKNILYLCPNGYLGGAEKFVIESCSGHLKYGHYHPTIIFLNDGVARIRAEDLGIPTILMPFKIRLRNLVSYFRGIFFLRRLLKDGDFSMVHATMAYSHLFSFWTTLGTKIKTIWFQHGPVGGLLDKIASLLPVDLLLFNSQYLKDLHIEKTQIMIGQKEKRIIPLGVEKEPIDSAFSSDEFATPDELIVGMVGRISAWKGYQTFIEAIAYLKQHGPASYNRAKFIIVGDAQSESEKKYLDDLQELTVKNNLAERVHFLGYRPDVANIHNCLDVLVHASMGPEPFGLVVAEAMVYETLVIGGDRGGITEILRDGETGITFSPAEPDSYIFLGEKLSTILSSYDSYKVIRLAGREHIHKNFSIKKMVDCLESSYDNII